MKWAYKSPNIQNMHYRVKVRCVKVSIWHISIDVTYG